MQWSLGMCTVENTRYAKPCQTVNRMHACNKHSAALMMTSVRVDVVHHKASCPGFANSWQLSHAR